MITAEQLLDNTSHMNWLTTSQKILVETMMETYKELALEEVKNNVDLHSVIPMLHKIAELLNNGVELAQEVKEFDELSEIAELLKRIADDNWTLIRN